MEGRQPTHACGSVRCGWPTLMSAGARCQGIALYCIPAFEGPIATRISPLTAKSLPSYLPRAKLTPPGLTPQFFPGARSCFHPVNSLLILICWLLPIHAKLPSPSHHRLLPSSRCFRGVGSSRSSLSVAQARTASNAASEPESNPSAGETANV